MNRIFLVSSLALSLCCGAAFAQQTPDQPQASEQAPAQTYSHGHRHAPDPQRQAEFISKKLNLTPDQTAKIEPILASRDQQVQQLRQNSQLTKQDRHQQMRAINETAKQQMATVLSPDQMAQLEAMRRAHRHHQKNENGGEPTQSPSL